MLSNPDYDESNRLCEMLPWYVNGTLTDVETQAVEIHLQDCEPCARELPVLSSLQTTLGKETVSVLAPAPDIEKFLFQLDKGDKHHVTDKTKWLVGTIAAGLALLAIALTDRPAEPVIYQTVIGADSAATFDYVLLVSLEQQIEFDEHRAFLQTLNPVSIANLETAGDYRIVVRLPARSVDDLEDYRQQIESHSAVSSASIVAIELPVEAQ